MSESKRNASEQAMDRLIGAGLRSESDAAVADDLAERVLAAREVGASAESPSKLLNFFLVAAGLLVVAFLAFEIAGGPEPDPDEPRQETRDEQSQDDENALRMKSVEDLRAHLSRIERIEMRDLRATWEVWFHDGAPRPEVAAVLAEDEELMALRRGLGEARRRSQQAGSIWPNSFRLVLSNGEYVEGTLLGGSESGVSFAGLGDCDVPAEVVSLLTALASRAERAARHQFGIIRTQADFEEFKAGQYEGYGGTLRFEGSPGVANPQFDLDRDSEPPHAITVVFENWSKNVTSIDLEPLRRWRELRGVVIRQGTINEEQIADLAAIPHLMELWLLDCTVFASPKDYPASSGCLAALSGSSVSRLKLPGFRVQTSHIRVIDLAWLIDISKMTNLRYLDLSREDSGVVEYGESIESLRSENASRLADLLLRELDLGGSSIPTDRLLPRMARTRPVSASLRLDLSGTDVTTQSLLALEHLPITELDLSGCDGVDGLVVELLTRIRWLRDLRLDRCSKLEGLDFEPLGRLNLRTLSLRDTQLDDEGILSWEFLPTAENLVLDFTSIGDASIQHLLAQSTPNGFATRSLSLVNCDALNNESLLRLTGDTPHFSELDLSLCDGISDEAIDEARRRHPSIRIDR
ncbi:MAG: hypothetical protein AAF196_00460 [Planctomycetota bacterium]